MKLLNEIVALLMNEDGSINEALLKTKVLLYEIGQKELVSWVNSELSGYARDAELPPYRMLHTQVYGTVTNGYYIYTRRILVVQHLRKKYGDLFDVAEMRQPIGVLEKIVVGSTIESAMTKQFGPQIDRLISEVYEGGYYVEGSYSYTGIAQIRAILIEVRSRLLDFILALRGEIGTTASNDDIRERTNNLDIPGMFGKAVFGDNTTIVVGSHNHQQVTNTLIKHNAKALADELRKHGVNEEDIEALDVAIKEDPAPVVAGHYGPAVQSWMKRMLCKAVDTSWDVSVGAAGSLLATALQKYYGF